MSPPLLVVASTVVEEVDDKKAMVNNLVLDSAMVKVSNSRKRTSGSGAEGMAIFKILTSENIRMLVLGVKNTIGDGGSTAL